MPDRRQSLLPNSLLGEVNPAVKIARDWNVQGFIDQYEVQEAGGGSHLEYWITAEDLDAFNASIVGLMELVRSFP